MSSERDPGRQGPVDFAPARLGGQRRRLDPSIVVGLVIVLGIGAAILKPWDDGESASAPTGAPSAAVAASPTPPASPSPLPDATPDAAAAVAEAALEAAVPRRERGVRVLVDGAASAAAGADAESADLEEAWYPVAEAAIPSTPVTVTSATPVRVLGMTASTDRNPLGVRFWRASDDEGWRWLDVPSLASDRPAAELLFAPPRLGGITIPAWPAGRYRLDLLMGTAIERIDLVLEAPPGGGGPLQDLDQAAVLGRFDREGETPALPGRPRFGPYAVASGVHRPLEAEPGPLLDPAAAWLDPGDRVARAVWPGAIALGVTLPEDALDVSGIIRRLAPDPVFDGPTARVIAADTDGDSAPAIEFVRGGGRAWAPGVYAIEATWRDGQGARSTAWHIELLPGSATRAAPLLDAARRYAGQAGREALIVSRPRRLGMEAGSDAVVSFPLGGEIGCDRSRMDDTPMALGLGLPDDAWLVAAEALRDRSTGGAAAVGLRLVPDALPGLALIAPRDLPRFRAGLYSLRLHVEGLPGEDRGQPVVRTVRICLGPPPFDG